MLSCKMPDVLVSFGLRRERLFPVPFGEQLFVEGEAVRHRLGVESTARVTVPVPCAPDVGAGFQSQHTP